MFSYSWFLYLMKKHGVEEIWEKTIPFEEQEASSSLIIELRLTLHPKSTADLPSSKYWPKKSQFHGSVHRPIDKMAFTGNCSRIVHLSVALSPSPVAEGEARTTTDEADYVNDSVATIDKWMVTVGATPLLWTSSIYLAATRIVPSFVQDPPPC